MTKEKPLPWLDEVMGVEHQNFFEGRATSYMKAGLRGRQDQVQFASLEDERSKNKEANLISFKVVLTSNNQIVTEFSMLPEKDIDKVLRYIMRMKQLELS